MDFVKKIMVKLKKHQEDSDFHNVSALFQELSERYDDLKHQRNAICKELMKQSFVPILSTYAKRFHDLGYLSSEDVWDATKYCLSTLWNYSDTSQEIANKVLDPELLKLLMGNVIQYSTFHYVGSLRILFLLNASIAIIHNVIRHHKNLNVSQNVELKETLVEISTRNNVDYLVIHSLITLSCLVDENDLHFLVDGDRLIKVLIKYIRSANQELSKGFEGFPIWKLVNGLRHISEFSDMKKIIVKEDGIRLMFDILKDPSSDENIEKCLDVLWNLCLDEDIKKNIVNNFDLKNVMKQFEDHKCPKIKKCHDGIFGLVNDEADLTSSIYFNTGVSEYKFDVFISYAWANKPIIMHIYNALCNSKINVWIDKDQMKGSTLEAMANGIDNSGIFIMAISSAYENSHNCRLEAEYAVPSGKPIIPIVVEPEYEPDSWLGIIMETMTPYDFSDIRGFARSYSGLLKNIEHVFINDEDSIVPNISETQEKVVTDSLNDNIVESTTKTESLLDVEKWSTKDVKSWLVKNKLGNFTTKFSSVDGRVLSALITLNTTSHDYLYDTLKNEYGMKLLDLLKFGEAIKEFSS